jgi:hypothetical protein
MKAIALLAMVAALSVSQSAFGQDGCKAATQSCSQMTKTCETRCQSSASKAGRCVAICASSHETCRSTGVWKSGMSPGCWRTNNRS